MAESIQLQLIGYHAQVFGSGTPSESLPVRILSFSHKSDLTLRAVSTRPRLHYSMDTAQIGDDGSFDWPIDVITHPEIDLRLQELAIVACTLGCSEARATEYWPVNLTAEANNGNDPPALSIVLRASVELRELFISAFQGTKTLLDQEPWGTGYFPPDRAIPIPVSFLSSGKATLDIVAVSHTGRSDHLAVSLIVP